MGTNSRPPLWLSLIVAASCLLAIAQLPYGYYQLLRIFVTAYSVWIALWLSGTSRVPWQAAFGFIAVLYNPVFKVSMSKDVHAVINVITAVVIIAELVRSIRTARAVSPPNA